MTPRKSCILLLTLFLPLSLMGGTDGNCIPVRNACGDEAAYKAGERLDFILHYTFGMVDSDIGTASITLDTLGPLNGRKAFHCRVAGKTTPLFDHFFKVREDFNSYFSYDGLVPLRFTRDTHEGSYTARNDYSYVWDADEPYIDATVFTTYLGEDKHMQIPLKNCTFDLPSLFFFARNIDMSRIRPGVRYPMTFAIDEEVFDVTFTYVGKATPKVYGLGTVKCLKFTADLLKGNVFSGKGELLLYISDDGNRLPVLFSAPLRVGDVEGRMTACSGLKYPFSALVKKSK